MVKNVLITGVAVVLLLAGCGGSPPIGAPGAMRQEGAGWVRPGRVESWMKPSTSKALLYVDDDHTNDAYVYEYPSGKLVGTLTGLQSPRGMCVDQKGDVYISNAQYGLLIEYAHAGTKPLNIYEDPGATLIGCSISASGDVAVTAAGSWDGYGNVCIWKGGITANRATCIDAGTNTGCIYPSNFGYDHHGDLIGVGGVNGNNIVCMIPAGTTTMEKLSTSGISVPFDRGGTSWDGRYIALSDYNGSETVVQPAKLSGMILKGVGSPIPLRDCYSQGLGPHIQEPFFFGKQNVTAASTTRATRVTGPSRGCKNSGEGVADVWRYPESGDAPMFRIPARRLIGGDAVSIKE